MTLTGGTGVPPVIRRASAFLSADTSGLRRKPWARRPCHLWVYPFFVIRSIPPIYARNTSGTVTVPSVF